MRQNVSARSRLWAGLLAVTVGLTLVAPPFAGAEPNPVAPPAAKSIRAATSAKLATADTTRATRFAQASGAGASDSKPFFKSTKGLAVAVLMVGGVAWMVASRHSDKVVHSPAK